MLAITSPTAQYHQAAVVIYQYFSAAVPFLLPALRKHHHCRSSVEARCYAGTGWDRNDPEWLSILVSDGVELFSLEYLV